MARIVLGAGVIVALTVVHAAQVSAAPRCVEPPVPKCVETIKPESGDSAINACRFKVQDYTFRMQRYARCHEETAKKAYKKADSISRKFEANCGQNVVKC